MAIKLKWIGCGVAALGGCVLFAIAWPSYYRSPRMDEGEATAGLRTLWTREQEWFQEKDRYASFEELTTSSSVPLLDAYTMQRHYSYRLALGADPTKQWCAGATPLPPNTHGLRTLFINQTRDIYQAEGTAIIDSTCSPPPGFEKRQ